MVITLTGDNDYARRHEFNTLLTEFIEQFGDLAVERLDGHEASPEQVAAVLNSPPLLAPKKLVVMDKPSAQKALTENLEQLFGTCAETTEVIIIEPKLDKRSSYFKYLKNKTDFREFVHLDEMGLAKWLVEAAKSEGGTLSLSDARYLIARIGTTQQILDQELQKLLLYNPAVTRQTINLLTEAAPQSTIFELIEAAFAGRKSDVARIYKEQRAQKVEPAYIVAMLAWQLHIVALLKTAGERQVGDIAKEARLNPYVVSKSQSIARAISLDRLRTSTQGLIKIDHNLKTSKIDGDEALQIYLLQLCETR